MSSLTYDIISHLCQMTYDINKIWWYGCLENRQDLSFRKNFLCILTNFTVKYNLRFSTDPNPEKSKTKCIFVCGKSRAWHKPANLILDGKQLPWVESAVHLGHVLHHGAGHQDQEGEVHRRECGGEGDIWVWYPIRGAQGSQTVCWQSLWQYAMGTG